MKNVLLPAIVAALAMFVADVVVAQQQPPRRPPGMQPGRQGGQGGRGNQNDEKPEYKPPDDPKVLELYRTMIFGMEKLAADYEKTNQIDKARTCYEEILRVAPMYSAAQDKLKAVKMKEAIADRRTFKVKATMAWQDTGISVVEGKPITIKASGTWNLKIAYTVDADGVEIPEELRNFPLGALVGAIAVPGAPPDEMKPFLIGTSKSFDAPKSGRLLLRIYDSAPEDNMGEVTATIEGTFAK
jgi:hypothetical protein